MGYGIKETLEMVELGLAIGKSVDAALEDGKIDFNDVGHLVSIVPVAAPAIKNADQIPKELGDLDTEEQQQIIDHVRARVGGETDKAWEIAVASLRTALSISHLVSVIRKPETSGAV